MTVLITLVNRLIRTRRLRVSLFVAHYECLEHRKSKEAGKAICHDNSDASLLVVLLFFAFFCSLAMAGVEL